MTSQTMCRRRTSPAARGGRLRDLGLRRQRLAGVGDHCGGAGEALAHSGHREGQAERLAPLAVARGVFGLGEARAQLLTGPGPGGERRGLRRGRIEHEHRRGEARGAAPLELAQGLLSGRRHVPGQRGRRVSQLGAVAKRGPQVAGAQRLQRGQRAGHVAGVQSGGSVVQRTGRDVDALPDLLLTGGLHEELAPGLIGKDLRVAIRNHQEPGRRELGLRLGIRAVVERRDAPGVVRGGVQHDEADHADDDQGGDEHRQRDPASPERSRDVVIDQVVGVVPSLGQLRRRRRGGVGRGIGVKKGHALSGSVVVTP